MKRIVFLLLVALSFVQVLAADQQKKSGRNLKSVSEIDLAIATVNEVEALNNGWLDANSGVFHPKAHWSSVQSSSSGPSLSK